MSVNKSSRPNRTNSGTVDRCWSRIHTLFSLCYYDTVPVNRLSQIRIVFGKGSFKKSLIVVEYSPVSYRTRIIVWTCHPVTKGPTDECKIEQNANVYQNHKSKFFRPNQGI